MPTRIVTPPAAEPVSVDEAKDHLRVDGDAEDLLIESAIIAAREYAEAFTGRQVITATLRLTLDGFPCGTTIQLRAPLQSVTSVRYYDTAGTLQTFASSSYHVDTASEPGRLVLADNASWPSTQCRPAAVEVEYVAGYGAAVDVPARIKQAILLDVGDAYGFRETQVVGTASSEMKRTVDALLASFRVYE